MKVRFQSGTEYAPKLIRIGSTPEADYQQSTSIEISVSGSVWASHSGSILSYLVE
jgi:hypothetical protein